MASPLSLSSTVRHQGEYIKFVPKVMDLLPGDLTYNQKLVLTALMQRPSRESELRTHYQSSLSPEDALLQWPCTKYQEEK